jgi:hypothetical protein
VITSPYRKSNPEVITFEEILGKKRGNPKGDGVEKFGEKQFGGSLWHDNPK